MSTESERILARYKDREKTADGFGRVIGVRRLKPSEQTKVSGMTAELTGYDEIPENDPETGLPTGNKAQLPHRMPLQIAASVCEIDGNMIPFPRNRGELDAIFDRLDNEGIAAATGALSKLLERQSSGGGDSKPGDEAKN